MDSVSWSAMIGGYARLGMSTDAVSLFRQMQIAGVCPDEITMVSVLSACTDLGALELGKWVESYIEKEGVQKTRLLHCLKSDRKWVVPDDVVFIGLLSACSHSGAGLIRDALEFVQQMPIEPNPIVWRTLINACRAHGELKLGEKSPDSLLEMSPCTSPTMYYSPTFMPNVQLGKENED
ncbi:hypothetical protein GH714_039371 [Hevea brasiliensis]|uniref:Pentacotripeptide-repeat region of PRORP domain-containing protein n=1 Tax=Hevea brasiliensis TaxID=3981 RepID=A0A6A6KE52_HEVBR|nr:hypothetical protein GH714_039371 [Hevea brasiliensis]